MKELLEKYYRGETSLEEERLLADRLASDPTDDELLLSALADLRAAEAAQKRLEQRFAPAARPTLRRRPRLLTWPRAAAACVIVAACCAALMRPAPAPAPAPAEEELTLEEARIYMDRAMAMLDDATRSSAEALREAETLFTNNLTSSQS